MHSLPYTPCHAVPEAGPSFGGSCVFPSLRFGAVAAGGIRHEKAQRAQEILPTESAESAAVLSPQFATKEMLR